MHINHYLSSVLLASATLVAGATGCIQADEPLGSESSQIVITRADLDALPQDAKLTLSPDQGYRFDTARGSIALDRVVIGQPETPIGASFRDAGLSAAQLTWLESSGFTLIPDETGSAKQPRDAQTSSLSASCTDRAYNILYWVAPSGSVSEYKVWYCRG